MTASNPPSGGILAMIARALLAPSVITVIATAIVGPMVAQTVVTRMKEAELESNRIMEQKKLQTDILQRVFKSTDGADFTDPSQVARLAAVLVIADENSEVFGLSFKSSVEKLKAFREDLESSEINAAQLQKVAVEKEKAELEVEKKKTEEEKVRLEGELADMQAKLKGLRGKRKDEMESLIAATTRALMDAKKADDEFKAKLETLNEVLAEKTQKIADLKRDLGERLEENEVLQTEVSEYKDLTQKKDASISELQNALKEASKSLDDQTESIAQLEANLKVAKAEKVQAEKKCSTAK